MATSKVAKKPQKRKPKRKARKQRHMEINRLLVLAELLFLIDGAALNRRR